ncbi:MAG: MaoC family dehydratase N-terminal domain-containing protein [Pseudomonadales bacterium]|nr:MaoC family dehydratase N-terminal domain-containing protein [Pseudomonadales bacterium]
MTNRITTLDEFEEEYAKGIGQSLPVRGGKEASLDNIRRFGDGVGDYNPLWRDPDYAAQSKYRSITAPPMFIYGASLGIGAAINGTIDGQRLSSANFPMNYAGGGINFHRPIWLGDRIYAEEKVLDVSRKHSERIGDFLICSAEVSYFNHRQELVARKLTNMARYKNLGGGKTIEYDRETKTNIVEESPDPLVFERQRQGNSKQNWELIQEGNEIPYLSKGTYTVTELFLFTHGVVGTGRSPRAALDAEESKDLGGGGRYDKKHAVERRNMPGQFDWGPQRVCWLCQIATDWAGDNATVQKMDTRVRHPNVVGDTNTVYGKISKKYRNNEDTLVDLEVWNENQAGLTTALSTVTLKL